MKRIHQLTGNPVRKSLGRMDKKEALKKFGLSGEKKTLLVLGGSLGARTINEAMTESIKILEENSVQIIGKQEKLFTNSLR